jgi:hypothetical protein
MNKHTPGPWNRIKGDRNVYSAAGTVCKTPAILGGGYAATNWEANARLIAAAPNLLEALEYAMPYLEACVPNPRNGQNADGSIDVNCVDRARAAIARAKGDA